MIIFWCCSLLLLLDVIATDFRNCYSEYSKLICSCDHHQMICSNHGDKLDFIPMVPKNIKMLTFTSNTLNNVTEKTFHNMTRSKITHLILAGNDIRYISRNTFREFTSLAYLDLSYNVIPVDLDIAFSNLRFVENGSLILNHMNITETKMNELFRYLDKKRIQTLSIAFNNLMYIDSCDWVNFPTLKTLNITGNELRNITFKCQTNVEIIHADFNNLVTFPNFCLDGDNSTDFNKTSVPNLISFSATNNMLKEIPPNVFKCMADLRELFITKNSFHEIELQSFYQLHTLELSSIFRYYQIIKPRSQSKILTASIEHLMLQNLSFRIVPTDLEIFKGLHRLRSLDLSYSNLPFSPMASKILFKPLSNLTKLTLQNVGWKSMPYNIFHMLPYLETLDLSNNKINYLNWSHFRYPKYLKEINFSNNRIFLDGKIKVPSSVFSLKSLDMSNNSIFCTCDSLSFFEELVSNNVTIKNYPGAYICTGPRNMAGKSVADVKCKQQLETIVFTVIITVLFGFAFAVIAYKSRYRIRYLIHISRSRRSWKSSKKTSQPPVFDGFVIYSEPDKYWLLNNLLPFLENQHGYRLCIHDRDFQYGRPIVDNIVENMDNSRKIVLILSNSFVESPWCKYEVRLANERFLEYGPDSLISIKLEDINTSLMENTLKMLIKFTTYAVWSEHNKEEFYVRILDCFQEKNDNTNRNSLGRGETENPHARNKKEEKKSNKTDKFEQNELRCMIIEIRGRIDSLEKSVKHDITFLQNKVHNLETNITLLKGNLSDSQTAFE
ncbi:toll-like receptor 13 [Mytilus galloprovincialis]|uniref:Toll-like receptor 13 n=2 Tax=Mytilus galloprovincialis TaxID=29158 RepID=A0A8B6HP28_MYTGA|nr:toll-like receptor 13 [Mytilus galloprovincialis]